MPLRNAPLAVPYIQSIYTPYKAAMGIVKISDLMHENLRIASQAMSRSINAQAEHWLKLGMLAELYPQFTQQELAQLLIRVELEHGSDLRQLISTSERIPQGDVQ